jgi:hypothetical protein
MLTAGSATAHTTKTTAVRPVIGTHTLQAAVLYCNLLQNAYTRTHYSTVSTAGTRNITNTLLYC